MITKEDIIEVKIIGSTSPKSWYAKYVGTDKIFKAVLSQLDDETPVYQTFFEGLMFNVDGVYWTYEKCLHANYIRVENAEIVKDINRETEIKIKLSLVLYSIDDMSLQTLLRTMLFDMYVNQIDWELVYKKMTELMPEVKL